MNVDTELQDYEAAGSLAEELPYWGWLDDERTCLTRSGELMSLARVSPSVLDGQTPKQRDRVIDRWQRMLSGLDARTRFYFYLLRRPIHFPEVSLTGASKVVTLGRRKRREFLAKRVQDVSAYVAWAYDPGLSTVASERAGGPWWMTYVRHAGRRGVALGGDLPGRGGRDCYGDSHDASGGKALCRRSRIRQGLRREGE